MTPEEFRDACTALGVTAVEIAKVIGTNDRTARRWYSGQNPVPPAVVTLVHILLEMHGWADYPKLAKLLRAEADRLDALPPSKPKEQ